MTLYRLASCTYHKRRGGESNCYPACSISREVNVNVGCVVTVHTYTHEVVAGDIGLTALRSPVSQSVAFRIYGLKA